MAVGRVGRIVPGAVRGLRMRLLAALLLTSAVTLAVAAVALLSPLQRRLQKEEVASLEDTAVTARSGFRELTDEQIHPHSREVLALAATLERRTGARVAVYLQSGRKLADTRPATPFGPIPGTGEDERPHGGVAVSGQAADEAQVAVPVTVGGKHLVIALRKPLDNVHAAASDVRRAFTDAALAGLGIALLLGVGIASTLLRRLRRLRAAALAVGDRGLETEFVPDRSRDEVGDLSRAFARMQSSLRRQEEARRSFVATASHELRTPLASLQGMLELLERDLITEPPDLGDARAQAHRAQHQAQRLRGLASDLLDLSRLDAEVELRSEPIELHELCRAVIAEFDLRVGSRRIELRAEGSPVWAMADPGSLARVIRILVDNALRFSAADENVAVTVGREGGAAAIAVEDRGPGVPAEDAELIFERFRRGSNHGADGGFGLGLAIGRELARRMGGELVLTAGREVGARFVLRLPAGPGRHDPDGVPEDRSSSLSDPRRGVRVA
jgi:signal transduction histidine kinase